MSSSQKKLQSESKFPQQWDLESLAPDPASDAFRKQVETLEVDLKTLADKAAELPMIDTSWGNPDDGTTVNAWETFLVEYEAAAMRYSDLRSVIGCYAADNAENVLYQQWEAQLAGLKPLQEEICTTLEFLLKEAPDEAFESLLVSAPVFNDRTFWLEELRKNAQFRMPRDEEVLASQLDVHGIHAWSRLYDQICGSLRISIMEKGEVVEKSPGQVRIDSPERSVRENEFYASQTAWNHVAPVCASALNQISGARWVRYNRLGVEDHLTLPLHFNRMSRETLNAMWNAISQRKNKLASYLQTKAKLLGLEKQTWYDLTGPLVGSNLMDNRSIPYDEGCAMILKAFSGFSDDLAKFAETALRERWVEAENRAGKRQGGFCTGISGHSQSRIFMTYLDSADSLATLAHELGHAYHSWVLRESPFFLQDYPMNLAETASTFAETVVQRQVLDLEKNPDRRLLMLDKMLQDSTAYLMNIHSRFLFEDRFHKLRKERELTADDFSTLMIEAQKEAYGNQLEDDGYNPTFWISKLHFYISSYPFYNFPYTFGYLLSQGIYQLGSEYGDEFPERYGAFLKATGCMSAEDAVQSSFGKKISKEEFWLSSLDIIDARIDEYQTLAAERLG